MRSVLIASALLQVCAMVSYLYILSTFSPFKTYLGRVKWCISSDSFTLQQTYYSPEYRGHLPTYSYNYADDDYDVYGLLLPRQSLEEEKGAKEEEEEEEVARDGSGEEGKEEEEDKEEEDDADGGRQQQKQQQQQQQQWRRRRRKKRE
jgi:hypothetical protein